MGQYRQTSSNAIERARMRMTFMLENHHNIILAFELSMTAVNLVVMAHTQGLFLYEQRNARDFMIKVKHWLRAPKSR